MPVIKMKPTSPGTRFRVKLDKSHLWKGGPHEPLTEKQKKHSGRFGKVPGRTHVINKSYVRLAPGQTIDYEAKLKA
jgi:ribosomal protein L2